MSEKEKQSQNLENDLDLLLDNLELIIDNYFKVFNDLAKSIFGKDKQE